MRVEWVWLALVLVGCERSPSKVEGHRDKVIIDDGIRDPDRDARLQTLNKIREHLAQPRQHVKGEADERLTKAYVDYTLAYGYARLGARDVATQLATNARRELDRVRSDPVHAYLIGAYEARLVRDSASRTGAGGVRSARARRARQGRLSRHRR